MPATDVSKDTSPASAVADTTSFQSTAATTAAAPIVAIAVYAIVLIARIPAAFNHFFVHTLGFNTQFFSISDSSHLSFFLSYCTTATNVPLGAAPSYIHCMLDSCDGFLPDGENQGYMYAGWGNF